MRIVHSVLCQAVCPVCVTQTSYETVLKDSSVFLNIHDWGTMIADEAHRFKSVSGSTRRVVTSMRVQWKLLLTGPSSLLTLSSHLLLRPTMCTCMSCEASGTASSAFSGLQCMSLKASVTASSVFSGGHSARVLKHAGRCFLQWDLKSAPGIRQFGCQLHAFGKMGCSDQPSRHVAGA